MLKWNLVIGTEATLRNIFGGKELADLSVGGGRGTSLVVAEQLPVGDVFEMELALQYAEVRECGAFE